MTVLFKSNRPTGRTCGTCRACCDHLEIQSRPGYSTVLHTDEDIAKAAGVACRFSSEQGCTIYEQRPVVCRNFYCDWIVNRKGTKNEESPMATGVIGVRGQAIHFSRTGPGRAL